jgi:hypothetical protein
MGSDGADAARLAVRSRALKNERVIKKALGLECCLRAPMR